MISHSINGLLIQGSATGGDYVKSYGIKYGDGKSWENYTDTTGNMKVRTN